MSTIRFETEPFQAGTDVAVRCGATGEAFTKQIAIILVVSIVTLIAAFRGNGHHPSAGDLKATAASWPPLPADARRANHNHRGRSVPCDANDAYPAHERALLLLALNRAKIRLSVERADDPSVCSRFRERPHIARTHVEPVPPMSQTLTRLSSHIAGLDTILGGGLIAGSSYIIQGRPGAGKTILANQIAFEQVRQGRKVLYITLLAESHDRLFQSLSMLSFYDASVVGKDLTYLSLFRTLRMDGLSALVDVLRSELARQGASMLILDGLLNARESSHSTLDVKTFVAELQGHAAFSGCTVLFLTSARIDDASPEHTMVDGVLQLEEDLFGSRTVRRMRVAKSRGSASLGGLHHYEINANGIVVFPRLESFYARPSKVDQAPHARVSSGVTDLDARIGGGLPESSATIVVGPGGSGKTSFGLNFLRLATPEKPALHFGFYETPARLASKARALDIDIDGLIASGALTVLWNPLTENVIDSLAYQLLDAVEARRIDRLVIDGLAGFDRAAVDRHRLIEFLAALTNQLRALEITTVCTCETRELTAPALNASSPEVLSLFDNVIGMQLEEADGVISHGMKVIKVRDSAFAPAVTKLIIANGLSGSLGASEGVVTGDPHRSPA